jgi:nitroreductase
MGRELIQTIFTRRSIRRYMADPVGEEDVKTLLEAAMAAPSAGNSQPWHFVAVTDRQTLDALGEVHAYGKMLFEAPLCIAVCGDPSRSQHWVQDCSAAAENLLLAAAALGLGAVWLGVHPEADRAAAIRKVLCIPESIVPLNLISMGYPAEEKAPRTQYDERRVHRERW